MKKNTKILIGSAAGIAVLGAAVLVLVLTQPADETQASSSSDEELTLLSYKADDISTLTIKNENGEFPINRLGSATWGSDSIPEEYANSTAYSSSMSGAGSIEAKLLAEKDAQDLAKYGFDNPTATFSMTFKDDKYEPISCSVGIKNEGESAWYFKTDENNDVYLVTNSQLSFAMGDVLDYVQLSSLTDAYDSENDTVDRVRIERADLENDLVLDKVEQDSDKEFATTYATYKMSSHNNILVDDEKCQDIVYGLFGLSATKAVAVNPDEQTKKDCGFDSPTCTASMVNGEEVTKLYIGAPVIEKSTDEETGAVTETVTGYYGMVAGKDVIYEFAADSLPWLDIQPENLLYRLFLSPYIYYVDNVTVVDTDKNEYKFSIIGDSSSSEIKLGDTVIDRSSFTTFYQYMLSCYADKIYVEDLTDENKFICSFTYNYRDENDGVNGKDVVELYSSESDRTCIVVVNGDVRYKTYQIYGTRFLDNLQALLNGGEIISDF